ncbi:class I SAM-dependent methyltransferase [Patescibacteria group bacterium]|uniref:Putative methyltransferase n=1 Tax=viral metagenome TaxID=1070528 RepID=A0A6M3M8N4_9ZZZZ|nr:class I SAM-dependent methyltransferase [Patescibacteria group bacterium]
MSEKGYWDARYRAGGTSGAGSVGRLRTWKWMVIRAAMMLHSPELVAPKIIDIGCGDLSFFDTPDAVHPSDYIGIDISEEIISRHRLSGRFGHSFILGISRDLVPLIRAPVVFCLDLLFHLMDDDDYLETLKNLCAYSEDLIFIYTWKYNPLGPRGTDDIYQKYRLLDVDLNIFTEMGFELIEENSSPDRIGCLYVFKRHPRL